MAAQTSSTNLAIELRRAIEESGKGLADLGTAGGVTHEKLRSFLDGRQDLTLTEAGTLCAVLGLGLVAISGSSAAEMAQGKSASSQPRAMPSTPPASALQQQKEATDQKRDK